MFLFSKKLIDRWRSRQPYYKKAERNWTDQEPTPGDAVVHSVVLVGDIGYPALEGRDPVLQILARELAGATPEQQTLVLLGDNIYPRGLPPEGHRLREISERRLKAVLDVVKDYRGNLFFLSGNHDWNKGRPNGYAYLQRQEAFVTDYLGRNPFLPADGSPGPIALELAGDVVLILLNTQWFVQNGPRPLGSEASSITESKVHFYQQLEALLTIHAGKRIVLTGHHPLYSNALHGGKFTPKQHLFPLLAAHKKLYLPLPIAGSLYPLYRTIFGAAEDMSHPRYRKMRSNLRRIFRQHQHLVYAAGHDHNLQYFNRYDNHYLVSGSGSKVSYVHKGGRARFTHAHRGFMRLDYHQSGATWLHVLEPVDAEDHPPLTVFRKCLQSAPTSG